MRAVICVALASILAAGANAAGAAGDASSVDFGDISHAGLKDLGPAPTGLKLTLELGLSTTSKAFRMR